VLASLQPGQTASVVASVIGTNEVMPQLEQATSRPRSAHPIDIGIRGLLRPVGRLAYFKVPPRCGIGVGAAAPALPRAQPPARRGRPAQPRPVAHERAGETGEW
jgi:hypothetical protein